MNLSTKPDHEKEEYTLKHLRKSKAEKAFFEAQKAALSQAGKALQHQSNTAINSYVSHSKKRIPVIYYGFV